MLLDSPDNIQVEGLEDLYKALTRFLTRNPSVVTILVESRGLHVNVTIAVDDEGGDQPDAFVGLKPKEVN